jgi:hypothetical protein
VYLVLEERQAEWTLQSPRRKGGRARLAPRGGRGASAGLGRRLRRLGLVAVARQR